MEVDPPKDEANANPDNAASNEKEGNKNEDAEMKEEGNSDAPKAEEPPKKEVRTEKRKKVVSKTIDLPVTSIVVGAMSRDKLETALEQERNLVNQDTYESDRLVAKNAVEEYIYNIREKICDELEEFMEETDRENFSKKLTEIEDWLYEDGENCEKAIYEEKLKDLKLTGEAAKKRKSEFQGRKNAIDTLGHSLQMAAKIVELYKAGDEKYNHLTDAEMDKVTKLIEEKSQWLQNAVASLEKTPKTVNPSTLNCQFVSEKDAFENICRPILSKAKPKVEPPPKEAKSADESKKPEQAEKNPEDLKKSENMETAEAAAGGNVNGNDSQQNMDLD